MSFSECENCGIETVERFCSPACEARFYRRLKTARRVLGLYGLLVQRIRSGPWEGRYFVIDERINGLVSGEEGCSLKGLEGWAAELKASAQPCQVCGMDTPDQGDAVDVFCSDLCRNAWKARLMKVRRALRKDGYRIERIRSGRDRGDYWVIDCDTGMLACSERGLDLEGLEEWVKQ